MNINTYILQFDMKTFSKVKLRSFYIEYNLINDKIGIRFLLISFKYSVVFEIFK